MSDKELKLQVELLQKQNKDLQADNRKLRERIAELTNQVEEFKFDKDIAQAINLANSQNV